MKAKDVGFVSEALGNITTLLNDLASSEKVDDVLRPTLEEKRDELKKIKEKLDDATVWIKQD